MTIALLSLVASLAVEPACDLAAVYAYERADALQGEQPPDDAWEDTQAVCLSVAHKIGLRGQS